VVTADLLPDELLDGYVGRLAVLNAKPNRASLVAALGSWLTLRGHRVKRSEGILPLVAMQNSAPVEEIVLKHTMWPAQRATDLEDEGSLRRGFSRKLLRHVGTAMRGSNWLCPSCVSEDVSVRFHGYWRRAHQLPGQLRCESHQVPLRYVSRAPFLVEQPVEALSHSQELEGVLRDCAVSNPHVARAMTIHTAMFNGLFRASKVRYGPAFVARSRLLGFEAGAHARYVELQSLVRQTFPAEWLVHAMPTRRTFNPLDLNFVGVALNGFAQRQSGLAVSVVAAALFGTAEEAISAMK
jgi:TniQ